MCADELVKVLAKPQKDAVLGYQFAPSIGRKKFRIYGTLLNMEVVELRDTEIEEIEKHVEETFFKDRRIYFGTGIETSC